MKNISLYLLTLLFGLCSCINHINEAELNAKISFRINEYDQEKFDNLQSRTSSLTAFSKLSFCIFTNNEKTQEIKQVASDAGFGTIKASIPYGEHQILVVGHNGTSEATVTSLENITFPDNRITDTFYYLFTINIDGETPPIINIALNRIVSKFELLATDKIPTGIQSIEIEAAAGGNSFNAANGGAALNDGQKRTIEIPSSAIGSTKNRFILYMFLPADEAKINITVSAKDADNKAIFAKTFEGVPMKINRITRYSGEFFKNGENVTGNISVNDKWADDLDISF